MASALSEEEFHRLQLQLLELRTANYEYDGKCKQVERELGLWQEKAEALDRDLQKANKAINKSKKVKEVELLLQENDTLQFKLQSQEDDFRLQNQTLMQELSTLVMRNEELEKDNECLKEGRPVEVQSKGDNPELEDEVRRLQAQNSALQKNLTSCQEKYEKELSNLRECVRHLKASAGDPDNQHHPPDDDMTEDADITESSEGYGDTYQQNKADDSNGNTNVPLKTVEDYVKEINDLKLRLDTESEEKKLIKDQMVGFGKKEKDGYLSLRDEVEKLSEKLRKKQESLVQLQEEKEQLYTESSKKLEELQAARERDQKHYTDQINKLRQELDKLNQLHTELENSSSQKIKKLENSKSSLEDQVNAASAETNQQLTEQNQRYGQELEGVRQEIRLVSRQNGDLCTQLQECQNANQGAMDQLLEVQKDRDSQIQALQEANKVAEKRKSLLDDLAIRYQKDADSHCEKVQSMEEQHSTEVTSLQQQLDVEKERSVDLEKVRRILDETKTQLASTEETKGWLQRRLAETEENFERAKAEHHETVVSIQESHQSEIETMRSSQDTQLQERGLAEEKFRRDIREREDSMVKLKQEIKDGVDEKKIHEKKGLTMLKDLKRQLHAERKRAEKLQERLQEVLSDSRNKGMEELFNQSDLSLSDPLQGDGSSVSSWSAGASGLGKDTSLGPQSPTRTSTPPSVIEEEYQNLLQRVAHVQQDKWNLEEKVAHLETSNSAMCDDLLQKTAIIEHYVMEGRSDRVPSSSQHHDQKMTLKKVLEIVNKGDEGMKDMNRKLQRILEETLTKNMHLQKDLELLSQEVVRLSKTPGGATSDEAGSSRMGKHGKLEAPTSTDCTTEDNPIGAANAT